MDAEDPIPSLREALRISPDNMPLRQYLADTLLGLGRPAEAEQEYCTLLKASPENPSAKINLAWAYYGQGKDTHALVIVEELLRGPSTAAKVYLLHARLLLRAGDRDAATRQYQRATRQEPSLADKAMEKELELDQDGDEAIDGGRVRLAARAATRTSDIAAEKPTINFDDVGGMEPVKDEIRVKIIHPLTHADLYMAYGKATGGGILMYGPPGCGKTLLARATAGEVKAMFVAVGIDVVLNMWLGESEHNLHQFFAYARSHKPCVLFFDEVDALAASRDDLKHSAGRQVVNQFLAELDGVKDSNEGVLILAATNAPWSLDSAFRRPGRFDRILFVPPPDEPARLAILNILLKGKPTRSVDVERIASQTAGYSGADLAALVDLAIEVKLREAVRSGKHLPLSTRDLLDSAQKVKPSTREWFAAARNYAKYANQAGTYDEVAKYLEM